MISKEIGWSPMSNALYDITKQLDRINKLGGRWRNNIIIPSTTTTTTIVPTTTTTTTIVPTTTTTTTIAEYPINYSGTVYYVKNDGDDGDDGLSPETAFATITKVNTIPLSAGDAVLFESTGDYEGQLNIGYSGDVLNDVTVGAYGSIFSLPKIYSSELITGWTNHSGNIWKATFATTINQLFVDGTRMQVARYPETGYANVDAAPSTSSLTCNALDGGLDYTGVKCLIHSSSYGFETKNVSSSSSKTLQLDSVPFGNVDINEKFILVGKLEFLTTAGQWFYDDATNTVYLWKSDSTEPTDTEVRGSTLDYGIVVSNKSYITIKDINILHPKVRGISLSGCDYITVSTNKIEYPDGKGIYAVSGSDYLTIEDNEIIGANHIGIELFTSNSTVTENTVSNIALPENLGLTGIGSWYMGDGIYVEGGNNIIEDNRVDETGAGGIHFNSGLNHINYNYITNVARLKNDTTGIYTSSSVNYQNEPNKGSIIRYNTILYSHGYGSVPYGEGIYLDESSGGITVEYNTVAYCTGRGIFAHKGNGHTIRFNKVFACENGFCMSHDGRELVATDNTIYGLLNQEVVHLNAVTGSPTIDGNKYINHYNSNVFQIDWGTRYNLADWRTTTSHDLTSTIDVSALTTGHTERLLVNPTATIKTYYLNAATNVRNEETQQAVSSDIQLQPYSSMIVTGLNVDCIQEYADVVAPVVTDFVIPATASSKTISISTFTASGSPTKYLITESASTPSLTNASWSTSIPTTFTTSVSGSVTLYAWVRDAAGNISTSSTDVITITLPDVDLGYTDVYATVQWSNSRRSMPVTMTEGGTINSISLYHSSGKTGNILLAVYSDNSGSPDSLLAVTAATAVTSVEEWQEINLITPVHVSSGTKVWLTWVTSISSTAIRSGDAAGLLAYRSLINWDYNAGMPSSYGASERAWIDYSIYCTYTPST